MTCQLNDEQKALANSIRRFIRREKKKILGLAASELHVDECTKIRLSFDNRSWKYISRLNWLPAELSTKFDAELKQLRAELLAALKTAQEIRLSNLQYQLYKADRDVREKNSNAHKLNWNLRTL